MKPAWWVRIALACWAVVMVVAFQQWGWLRVTLGSVFFLVEIVCIAMYVLRAGRPTT